MQYSLQIQLVKTNYRIRVGSHMSDVVIFRLEPDHACLALGLVFQLCFVGIVHVCSQLGEEIEPHTTQIAEESVLWWAY